MAADMNFCQKLQRLGTEEQDGPCEVRRGDFGSIFPELEWRHWKYQIVSSLPGIALILQLRAELGQRKSQPFFIFS
jgi:hypothetical protein